MFIAATHLSYCAHVSFDQSSEAAGQFSSPSARVEGSPCELENDANGRHVKFGTGRSHESQGLDYLCQNSATVVRPKCGGRADLLGQGLPEQDSCFEVNIGELDPFRHILHFKRTRLICQNLQIRYYGSKKLSGRDRSWRYVLMCDLRNCGTTSLTDASS